MWTPPPLPDDHSNKARKDKMILGGGALGVEKGSLEKVSKLCSGLSKWTSISGHLTLIVPVRVCMHARVCVYVCVYNGYERLHSQREREAGREEAILQQSTISDCGQTTNGWKVLERREKPASLAFQLPAPPPKVPSI